MALDHAFFKTEPLPCEPSEIPKIEGNAHEMTVRRDKQMEKKNLA